jgi:hypothetical protein
MRKTNSIIMKMIIILMKMIILMMKTNSIMRNMNIILMKMNIIIMKIGFIMMKIVLIYHNILREVRITDFIHQKFFLFMEKIPLLQKPPGFYRHKFCLMNVIAP